MRINIYGMGYVGCVTAACLANDGHHVFGIDTEPVKVDMINAGKSPIIEEGLEDFIKRAIDSKRLIAQSNELSLLKESDVSFICVGTPSNRNGSLNLNYVKNVSIQIGKYLRKMNGYHVVNVRSTVLPGTVENIIIPLIESNSKKKAGREFGICMNPEFLRESTSIEDFYSPPFTVIGELDKKSGDAVSEIYKDIKATLNRTDIKTAEMVKYACNCFHGLKVSFANEIGNICKKLNFDSHKVMDIFCQDRSLNLSPYYLKPGFAFGGSCLPKDLKALNYEAKTLDLEVPVLSSILESNINQIQMAFNMIKDTEKRKIGILGLSFKVGTDDLRESPTVELIEKLIGKGYEVNIFDKEVAIAKIFGSNKKYIEMGIPHISSIMKSSIQEVIDNSEVIVVTKNDKMFKEILNENYKDKQIIDLVRIDEKLNKDMRYEGLCW